MHNKGLVVSAKCQLLGALDRAPGKSFYRQRAFIPVKLADSTEAENIVK